MTPWTIACQAPLSIGFSRQEYWSGLPCPPPGDLPKPGTEPVSRNCLQEASLPLEPPENIAGRIMVLPVSVRVENGNPIQYSCLKNLLNRGTWQATVHGVT